MELIKNVDFNIDKEEIAKMDSAVRSFVSLLEEGLKKRKVKADVFIGGSFAKKTMIKGESYDIDFFVRFIEDGEISDLLESVLKEIKSKYLRVHGSRDYFQIKPDDKVTFEVIPILKIKTPKEAKNVTDLSYFHVNYVKKNISEQIAREIRIAKQFLKAQGIYGAESYIGGISGYGVECLIIYYKTFEKMAKAIVKASGKILIDPEKKHKGKDILLELNESKLESPIVLVDPTFKERNVLAALRKETFDKLKTSLESLLRKPRDEMFEIKDLDVKKLETKTNKVKGELVKIRLFTDRQEGDIAGTKMKKFSDFIANEMIPYFEVISKNYVYKQDKEAELYLVVKPKAEIIKKGPPLEMIEHAKAFRKEHKNTIMKAGILYAKIKGYKNAKEFLKFWTNKNKDKIKEMDIVKIEVN